MLSELRDRAGRFTRRAATAPPAEDHTNTEDNGFAAAETAVREAEARLSANIGRSRQLTAELETLRSRHEDAIAASDIDGALRHEAAIHRLELEIRVAENEAAPLDAAFERARAILAQLHARAARVELEALQGELDQAALLFAVALDKARTAHFALMQLGGGGYESAPPAIERINGWYVQQCCHRARLRLAPAA